ncbi:NfeD family protein [Caldisphaera sp.]|uniref:NfeD family protein n=1 Tax=Caldisphaera sp. TaxID=2060322 RepID=UPI0025B935E1|nr:NfeD family protein [Caldisphaera sp.]
MMIDMKKTENVGFFSRIRWGFGSILLVILLIIFSAIFIYIYHKYNSNLSLFVAILFLIVVIIIVFVKSSEIILPMNPTTTPIIGKTGIVIKKIEAGKPGVVKIDNQLWSAYSDTSIKENTEVIVTEVNGIYVKVKEKTQK